MTHKPSYAPVLMAAGLMGTLWGAVTTWLISAIGLIVVAIASVRWIHDAGQAPPAMNMQPITEPVVRATAKQDAAHGRKLPRTNPWLCRYSILVAVCTFALVISGALVTSNDPLPSVFLQRMHLLTGTLAGVLAGALAMWLRGPAWLLLAAVLVEALLGGRSPAVGALHAFLAQLFFAGTVAIALITSRSWINPMELTSDSARFSLRKLSLVALPLLVLQVALGAAYRHKAMGVMPHIIGALVVTLALLLLAVLVTNQYSEHRALRPAAKILIAVTFTQVMLGMGAFITRLMMAEGTLPVVIVSVAHVATGSLTLASTAVLTLLIQRYLTAG